MHAHDGGTEHAYCVVPSAVEGSTPQAVPSGPSRRFCWHYGGPVHDRREDVRLDRMGRVDSVYGCSRGGWIREAVKGIWPGLLIAERPRLHDLRGPALAQRASLHGVARMRMPGWMRNALAAGMRDLYNGVHNNPVIK